jgi:hypothetical protein
MNVFEMIVLIVALVTIGKFLQVAVEKRHRGGDPGEAAARDERLANLEERVRVLETIVTDSGYDLRRQFKDLERDA